MSGDLDPKRFPRISLDRQANALGIPITDIKLPYFEGDWFVGDHGYSRPEDAALATLTADGGLGVASEGFPLLLWIKCAAFETLAAGNTLGRRDTCSRYTEALCKIQERNSEKIIAAAKRANKLDVFAAIDEISDQIQDTEISSIKPFLGSLHDVAGSVLIDILKIFLQAPYSYRAGWPDVTIVKDGKLQMFEVKTTDKIHKSQRRIIEDIGVPCNLPIEVTRISPARA